MRRMLGALVLFLAGCVTVPWQGVDARVAAPESFTLAGRFFLVSPRGALSGGLRWSHSLGEDDLMLLTPGGQGIAHLVRTASGVELTTPESSYRGADTASMIRQAVGLEVSLEDLSHWLLGRPAPGSDGAVEGASLRQGAWRVELPGADAQGGLIFPGKLVARGNETELRLVVDEWNRLP